MAGPKLPPFVAAVLIAGFALFAAGVPLKDSHGGLAEIIGDWGLVASFGAGAVAVTWRAVAVSSERAGWTAFAIGLWIYTLATVVFNVWIVGLEQPPFPSVADWMWICLQLSALVGLLLVGRARRVEIRGIGVLDGIIVTAALWGICAVFVYEPAYQSLIDGGSGFGLIVPLFDFLVLAFIVVGTAARGWRPAPSAVLQFAAFSLLAFGDSVYVVTAASDGWAPGTWIDLPFGVAMVLLGLSAWAPTPRTGRRTSLDHRHLAIPLIAGCTAVGLVAAALVTDLNPVADASILTLVAAVVVRLGITLRINTALLSSSRQEALTDALTGLRNRRSLVLDLEDALEASQTLVLFDLDGFKAYNDTRGHAAGDRLLAMLAQRLGEAVEPYGRSYRMGGDEFCILVDASDARDATTAAAQALHERCHDIEITCSWGQVGLPDEASTVQTALRLADRRMYAMKNGRPNAPGAQLRAALTRVLDIREPELSEHANDVGRLAVEVARSLGLPEHALTDIRHGAELHDIGKLAIPQAILDKPGPLDDAEWEVMRRHTVLGEQLLSGIPALAPAAQLVRASHERFDGDGYPDRIGGEEIPLGARVIAVCDAYDAMVTDRPYRQGIGHVAAMEELAACAGSQFDPGVVAAFASVIEGHLEELSASVPSSS